MTPPGWREAAGAFGEDGVFRSVADIVDDDSLLRVRETKKAVKAERRASAEKPVGEPAGRPRIQRPRAGLTECSLLELRSGWRRWDRSNSCARGGSAAGYRSC